LTLHLESEDIVVCEDVLSDPYYFKVLRLRLELDKGYE